MINKKEVLSVIIAVLILSFVVTISKNINEFTEKILFSALMIFIILALNIIGKKIMAYYLDSEIEVKLWEVQRYGFKAHRKFKRPVPAGVIVPIIVSVVSLGYIKWMASLVFDVKASVHRAARRHGLYTFSEITENHIGLIAAAGIILNLIAAVAGYFLGYEEFARLNIYFIFFNMLPVSDLDGNKIFFGSLVLWSFLAALSLVGIIYAAFLI